MKYIQTVFFHVIIISELSCVLTLNNTERKVTGDLPKRDNTKCINDNTCIMKCCPVGKYIKTITVLIDDEELEVRLCEHYNETRTISNLVNENIFTQRPELPVFDVEVKSGIFETNDTFKTKSMDVTPLLEYYDMFLTEYAEVQLEIPNSYHRWTYVPNNEFCWDYKIVDNEKFNNLTLEAGIWVLLSDESDTPSRTSTILMTTAMLISCFFLFVVLVVYMLLQELRNLCGLILMAYVASLLGALFSLAVMRIANYEVITCISLTLIIYFFFLASFCWMSVMSYDIWWTFRGYAKARPIHRRGERFKFLMYCLYAWGVPLAMTIGLGVLTNRDLRHIPWFVTPKIPFNGCFLDDGVKMLYLYTPMLILILCNWMFYIMTAYNVWRLSRGTAVLDSAAAGSPQAHRTHHHRFMVYLKLSVVMGLNWLLEVVSYIYPNDSLWIISDFYNILIGVTIFLIFVCKQKILRKLIKLFLKCKKSHWRPGQLYSVRSTTSSSDSNSSPETQTLQVCSNPKGPGYVMEIIPKA